MIDQNFKTHNIDVARMLENADWRGLQARLDLYATVIKAATECSRNEVAGGAQETNSLVDYANISEHEA